MSAAFLGPFPRIRLAHLPTPLEPLEGLTRVLGGPRILVKRDDCTGLAGGGNKTRKLEYLMGEARRAGADLVLTGGGVQSNHVRQTAAAAARLGLACEVVLEPVLADADEEYEHGGNVLLDRILGARIRHCPAGMDLDHVLPAVAAEHEAAGRRPYVVPVGGSNATGALGYVGCAVEIVEQARARGIEPRCIVHATGSAGTQAGLLVGLRALGAAIPVVGVCVSRPAPEQEEKVFALASATASRIGLTEPVPRQAVRATGDYVGAGYGIPTDAMVEAVETLARSDGMLLDPVYTGKAMAGLIDLVRAAALPGPGDGDVIFVHTGGSPALFAYRTLFT